MDASSSKNNESKFTEDLTGTEWYEPNGKKIGGLQDMLALKKKAAAKQKNIFSCVVVLGKLNKRLCFKKQKRAMRLFFV